MVLTAKNQLVNLNLLCTYSKSLRFMVCSATVVGSLVKRSLNILTSQNLINLSHMLKSNIALQFTEHFTNI